MAISLVKITLLVFIITISTVYFTTVTRLSSTGDTLVALNDDLTRLEKENREIIVALSKRYGISRIEEEVKQSGLISDTHFVYIKTPSSLAVSKR